VRKTEASAGAVVATDPVSVNADYDNGAALRIRVKVDGSVKVKFAA
jgi:hypothetical protein